MRLASLISSRLATALVLSVMLGTSVGAQPVAAAMSSSPAAAVTADAPAACHPTALVMRGNKSFKQIQAWATWSVSACGTNWIGYLLIQNQTGPTDWVTLGWPYMNCNVDLWCLNTLDPSWGKSGTAGFSCKAGNFRAVMVIDSKRWYGPSQSCLSLIK